jgi:hypothetical protein
MKTSQLTMVVVRVSVPDVNIRRVAIAITYGNSLVMTALTDVWIGCNHHVIELRSAFQYLTRKTQEVFPEHELDRGLCYASYTTQLHESVAHCDPSSPRFLWSRMPPAAERAVLALPELGRKPRIEVMPQGHTGFGTEPYFWQRAEA